MTLSMYPAPVSRPTPRILSRVAILSAVALLSACVPMGATKAPRLDDRGASVQGIYPVTTANVEAVRMRATETLNTRRTAAGLAPVVLDPTLVTAADRGSTSMSAQGRAWLFGEDGSTPSDRARNAGFNGPLIGEVVSETWENEIQAIDEWMATPQQRAILMDPNARRVGVGIHQEESMKLWWTLTVAN